MNIGTLKLTPGADSIGYELTCGVEGISPFKSHFALHEEGKAHSMRLTILVLENFEAADLLGNSGKHMLIQVMVAVVFCVKTFKGSVIALSIQRQ